MPLFEKGDQKQIHPLDELQLFVHPDSELMNPAS